MKVTEGYVNTLLLRYIFLSCISQRARNELDNEMMLLTGQILGANPDFYTLWNIRRELIEEWIRTRLLCCRLPFNILFVWIVC